MSVPHLYVAIPAMDELQDLPLTLADLKAQSCIYPWQVLVCVNQPESYRTEPEKQAICEHNIQLLNYLQHTVDIPLRILDHASPGKGWRGKKYGVGWARKVLLDEILPEVAPDDLIVSLDADTRLPPNYLQTVAETMLRHPALPALSVPYYHLLTGEEKCDRAILRYELYMRNYAINLYKIGSPFAFTALGSAIVMRAGALKKIGGITPIKSGEDFYLLQKFRKMAPIGQWSPTHVFPAARYSDRVAFGTGPALIKGSRGDWNSYPLFHHQHFKNIALTYAYLPQLYREEVQTDFLLFLQKRCKNPSLWSSIRLNVKDYAHFSHAFHEQADGLRIIQYVRQQQQLHPTPESQTLYDNLSLWQPSSIPDAWDPEKPLHQLPLAQLDTLRKIFTEIEEAERKKCSLEDL